MADKSQEAHAVAREITWTAGSSVIKVPDAVRKAESDSAPKAASPSLHPAQIGRYLVEEYLGGGMARVYRAQDPVLGKTVAVKILKEGSDADQAQRDRFLVEARIAANMEHPNIVNVYDFGEDAGQPYMVMEFLKGENLRAVIRENRAGDFNNKLRISLQMAKALEHIHAHGIFHRDIKPENVHLTTAGVVKLMDFGIAKKADLSMTRPGFMVGTPYYMAPEQVQGKDVTGLADVYAFGILLFELFTGIKPITGEAVEQVLYNILHDPINLKPLHDAAVPSSLIALIASCAAKDPSARPQNVSAICVDLQREIDALEQGKTRSKPGATFFSNRWVLALVFLLAVTTVFAVSYSRRAGPPERGPKSDTSPQPPVRLQTDSGEMMLIPGGEFLSGESKTRERLPAFYIDRLEVTNELYGKFSVATHKEVPEGFAEAPPNFPVVNITIDEARQFARWAGKRLPTRMEWQKAARGSDGRAYPWGDEANAALANVAAASLAPVTAFSSGDSPWRVRQMVGNAWEFVDELSTPSSRAIANFAKLLAPAPTENESWYLIMGGSFFEPLLPGAAYDAAFSPARFHSPRIGFRCVMDLR